MENEKSIHQLLEEVGSVSLEDLSPELKQLITTRQVVKLESPTGFQADVQAGNEGMPEIFKVIDDVIIGNNVFLVGEAGTGKTTLAEQVAKALGRALIVINCNQWTSPTDLKGGQTIEGYKEGGLIEAWKEGKILVLDELPKLDPNTAGILNDALAKTSHPEAVIFNGNNQAFTKHKNFGVIATGNVTGKGTSAKYAGNNKQDASLIDRFSGSYYLIDFNREFERSLVFSKVFEIADKIREELIKHKAEEIMTLRTMLNFNRAYLLEMERETGKRDRYPKGNGKTLEDAIKSYFQVMSVDKAKVIAEAIDLQTFLNTYKDRKVFENEYKSKVGKSS